MNIIKTPSLPQQLLPFDCQIDISIDDICWLDLTPSSPAWVEGIARATLARILPELPVVDFPQGSALVISLLFTNDQRIQELNRDFRGIDKPTNVLSFPDTELSVDTLSDAITFKEALTFGDIAFAEETIRREAIEQDKCVNKHLAHLIVHGVLHLAGYDHIEDEEAEHMEALEIQILDKMKIDNPYGLDSHSVRMNLD